MGEKPAPRPPNKGTPLSSGLNVAAGLGSWRAGNSSGLDTTEVATRTGGTRPTAPVEEEGEGGPLHARRAGGSPNIVSRAKSGTPGFPDAHMRVPGLRCAPLTSHSSREARGAHRSERL